MEKHNNQAARQILYHLKLPNKKMYEVDAVSKISKQMYDWNEWLLPGINWTKARNNGRVFEQLT